MRKSSFFVLALSFCLLALTDTAQAADKILAKVVPQVNTPSNGPTNVSAPGVKNLYTPVPILNRPQGYLTPRTQLQTKTRSNQIPIYDPVLSALEDLKRAVIAEKNAWLEYTNAGNHLCYDGSFSRADQSAAGCLPTDTIVVCYEKCSHACLVPYETRYLQARGAVDSALRTILERVRSSL